LVWERYQVKIEQCQREQILTIPACQYRKDVYLPSFEPQPLTYEGEEIIDWPRVCVWAQGHPQIFERKDTFTETCIMKNNLFQISTNTTKIDEGFGCTDNQPRSFPKILQVLK
jgi:hypothetical protein